MTNQPRKRWTIFNAVAPAPGLTAYYDHGQERPVVAILILKCADEEIPGVLCTYVWAGEPSEETIAVPGVFDEDFTIVPAQNISGFAGVR